MLKIIEVIKETAYKDELQKIAGIRAEALGTLAQPVNLLAGYPAALIGAITGPKTHAEMAEQDKKTWSNIIPGVGPYRMARRGVTSPYSETKTVTKGKDDDDKGKKKHKKDDKD